jgi:hypothetical protein
MQKVQELYTTGTAGRESKTRGILICLMGLRLTAFYYYYSFLSISDEETLTTVVNPTGSKAQ